MTQSECFELIRAGSPLLAALLAGGVAWKFGSIQAGIARQQATTAASAVQTAKNKLKLDLFDRRLAIYDAVCDIVDEWILPENQTSKRRARFVTAMNSSRWIFPEEVYQYLKHEVYTEMNDLQVMHHRSELTEEEKKECLRIEARLMGHRDQSIDQVFGPHLTLEA